MYFCLCSLIFACYVWSNWSLTIFIHFDCLISCTLLPREKRCVDFSIRLWRPKKTDAVVWAAAFNATWFRLRSEHCGPNVFNGTRNASRFWADPLTQRELAAKCIVRWRPVLHFNPDCDKRWCTMRPDFPRCNLLWAHDFQPGPRQSVAIS